MGSGNTEVLPATLRSLISPSCPQQDKEYVGFAALPNQLHRKSVKKGFDFTLMVAGLEVLETDLGVEVSSEDPGCPLISSVALS